MIKVFRNSASCEFTSLTFSGGEIQVRVKDSIHPLDVIRIEATLYSAADVMELVMLVDALRRYGATGDIHLLCPYLPYARQDRVCYEGEALGLKVMCDLINSLNFTTVSVWDVHSDVALALLDRVRHLPQWAFVTKIKRTNEYVLVAPDAGARKKTAEAAKFTGAHMVSADKIRSPQDGSITGTKVYSDHIGFRDFLVVDDICDGGRTFIELAKELDNKSGGKKLLYVTHGIFSKGLEPLFEHYDQIYCANIWPQFHEYAANYPDKLTIVR